MNENFEYENNFNNFLKSIFISNKEILKYFIKKKSGSIINFSSISYKKNLQDLQFTPHQNLPFLHLLKY